MPAWVSAGIDGNDNCSVVAKWHTGDAADLSVAVRADAGMDLSMRMLIGLGRTVVSNFWDAATGSRCRTPVIKVSLV